MQARNDYLKASTLFGLLALGLMLTACDILNPQGSVIIGSGRVVSQTRQVDGIDAVALLDMGEVFITQGATEGLTIEAEDNLLPLITSEVEGGTLELRLVPPSLSTSVRPTLPITFYVSVRDLSAIDLSGSGNFTAQSLAVNDLEIDISGSGNVSVDSLSATDLRAILSGSGTITLAGAVTNQTITLSGSGDYAAGDMESQSATINLSGSGSVTAWVEQALDIVISGSGAVSYFGQPTVARRDITGTGDINPMGDK